MSSRRAAPGDLWAGHEARTLSRRHEISLWTLSLLNVSCLSVLNYVRASTGIGETAGRRFLAVTPDDVIYYLTRVKAYSTGNFDSNPYLASKPGSGAGFSILNELLLAAIMRFFSMDPVSLYIIYASLTAPVLFTGLFIVALRVVKSAARAAIAASFAAAIYNLLLPDLMLRTVSPSMHLFWLLCFLAVLPAMPTPLWRWGAAVGLSTVCWFSYPYFGLLTTVSLILATVATHNRGRLLHTSALSTAAVVSPLAWIAVQAASSANSGYETGYETLLRTGLVHSHLPGSFTVSVLCALAVVWALARGLRVAIANPIVLAIAGILLCANSQVVTGLSLEFNSHYWPSAVLLVALLAASATVKASGKRDGIVLPVAVAASALLMSAAWASVPREQHSRDVDLAEQHAISALMLRARPGDVVLAPQRLAARIPLETKLSVVYAREANLFSMSDSENFQRWLTQHFLDSRPPQADALERELFGVKYIDWYARLRVYNSYGLAVGSLSNLEAERKRDFEELRRIRSAYRFSDAVKSLGVDWVVVSPASRDRLMQEFPNCLQQVRTSAYLLCRISDSRSPGT